MDAMERLTKEKWFFFKYLMIEGVTQNEILKAICTHCKIIMTHSNSNTHTHTLMVYHTDGISH